MNSWNMSELPAFKHLLIFMNRPHSGPFTNTTTCRTANIPYIHCTPSIPWILWIICVSWVRWILLAPSFPLFTVAFLILSGFLSHFLSSEFCMSSGIQEIQPLLLKKVKENEVHKSLPFWRPSYTQTWFQQIFSDFPFSRSSRHKMTNFDAYF